MITVLKKKISFDKIPLSFYFSVCLSVPVCVCVSVCLSVRTLYATVLITQTCRSIFRQRLCTANVSKIIF